MASSSKTLTLDSSHLFLAALQSQSLPPPPPPPSPLSLSSPIPSSYPPSKLIPNTRFLVDAFRGDSSFSVSYFLSHFHSDHYAGLSPTWSKGIIFSSPTTALLLTRVLKLPSPFVVPLPLRQTVVIDGCQITLIDANHCPGAVQFLFNIPGPNGGRYVHTGDFRFSDSMRFDSFLTQYIGSDAVFLDTTYCNPKFVFPSQHESIDYVVSVIDRVRVGVGVGGGSLRDVLFLVATYVVGKERILLEIARRCNRKIHVDARKMEVLRVLGYGESGLFTEDVCESDVHVVGWNVLGETWPYFRPNFVKMKEIMDERGYSKVVGFVPTGWTYEVKRNKFAVRTKDSFEIHLVPYSEHSNYDELRDYVKLLKPKRVIPTVGLDVENLDSKHADKMQKHFAGLVDEMANKQEFLRGFYRGSCEVVDKVERDASTNEELDKENEIKETKAKGSDINDPGFALDNSSSPKEPGIQDPVVLNDEDISSLEQSSSPDPVMLNEEDMEKLVQELRDCLPTWVTHNQILDLISSSGRNIVEAVSNFYERETEFHEQVLATTATTSVTTSQSSSLNVSASLSKAGFVMSSPIGSIDNALSKVYKSANLKHSCKSNISPGKGKGTIDNKPNKKVKVNSIKSGTSPGKRKMNVENKTNKKVNSKLESGGSKQSTITSFFSKVLPDVSKGGKVGTLFEQSPIDENLLPDDSAKFYRDEIDQFIQIINGNESSRSCAATILEKTKGDINKALDIYFCNHEGDLGDSNKSVLVQSSVNNCSPGQKKNVLEKEHVPDISLQSTLRKDVDATPVSLPPEKYNPIEHACWRSRQPAPYIHLARTFDQLEDEKGKIKATSMLCNMFRSLLALSPEDVLPAVYLCTNKIAADHENIELNIGGSLVSSALEEACGTNRTKLKEMYNKIGDLGDVAQECRQTQTLLAPPSPLLIRDVFSALRKISLQTGSGSTVRKKNVIVNLMCSCREKEMKFLVRTLVRNLRIGAMMRTVLPALAQAVVFNSSPNFYREGKVDNLKENLQFLSAAVVEAYNILPNLDLVVPSLMNKGVKFSSSTLSMVPGIPIKPMLAKITNGVPQALKLFQNKAFSCEYKYDGQRAQIHRLVDGTVRIFSRNGDESTSRFPDVINIIKESCRPAAMTFILDAEVVAVDRKNGFKLMSFQELSSRGRGSKDNLITVDSIKVDICVFVFDIMFANGQQLLGFSLRKRRKYLKDLFHDEKLGYFEYAKEMTVEADDACLTNEVTLNKTSSFLEDAIRSSCEGLVVKLLDFDAEYYPSKRTDTWLKVKRDYVEGLCDSLDLVPIGAWHGNGRKAGWYSPFLMACYNPDMEEFQSVCRVMSGFSDSFYIEMKDFFSGDKILSKKPPYYRTAEVPDKWFSPELVWQIRGADFTLSPVHQAAIGLVHPSRGISIRFPRFINPVSDRNPEESSTAADIAEMFQSQTRKMDVTSEA